MTDPVDDQDLVVHLFALIDGPQAEDAYQQIRRMWTSCSALLGTTKAIGDIQPPMLLPERREELPSGGIVAGQENPKGDRQVVLRRVGDVLNLSVALIQPSLEGLNPQSHARLVRLHAAPLPTVRRLGWAEFAQVWTQARTTSAKAVLGEVRLFIARAPSFVTGTVAAAGELGRALEPLLPYREDRLRDWWRWGATTTAGYAAWDTRLADSTGIREIVLIAASDRDAEFSAWAWSDGTPGQPPFARYLMAAAKLRYHARLFDARHQPHSGDTNMVQPELDITSAPGAPRPDRVEFLRTRLGSLRAEENRLTALETEQRLLHQQISTIGDKLREAAGRDGDLGMFAEDLAQTRGLIERLDRDLSYLKTDLDRTTRTRSAAAEELREFQGLHPATGNAAGNNHAADEPGAVPPTGQQRTGASTPVGSDVSRQVFVVHGRDATLTERFYGLLRAVDLRPLEWQTLVRATGSGAPYIWDVVAKAPHQAPATLVLLTPDDIVELHPDLFRDDDLPHERGRAGQARPNVLFELGMALMAYPRRTIIVAIGKMRPFTDIAGLDVIQFDGSSAAIKNLVERLKAADCRVDDSGTDWIESSRFDNLRAYRRGPEIHEQNP